MSRIFLTKAFLRFAKKAKLPCETLRQAALAVMNGEHDADLGGGVFKQRVARPREGKSGGLRTIVLFRSGRHLFFVYGFAKSRKPNIDDTELRELRRLAGVLTGYSEADLIAAVAAGNLSEIAENDQEDQEAL
jgi:hypothetical protein